MGRNAKLKSSEEQSHIDPRAPDFLSSHPATPERIRSPRAAPRQFNAPGAGERDKAAYLASVDGMVYGEDPSEGFVRGRRFLHPSLGFTFLALEGFVLDTTAQAVRGVKEAGGQPLRLAVVRVPEEQPLADYLSSGGVENTDPKSVEEVVINGLPAATATAKGDQWVFRLYAVRFGSDVYRFIFASKRTTAEVDRAFRESVGTFRRMTLAESQAAKPLHIKIVTVAAGDTVERLASRMAVAGRAVERFRVLNGLGPNDRANPGDQGKIAPDASRAICAEFAKQGVAMLDAPISGSPVTLAQGNAAVMVGGDKAAFERIEPVLRAIGPKVTYIGASGLAVQMKIAVNLLLMVEVIAFGEAVALAEKGGVAREIAVDAILKSVAASPVLGYRGPFILEGKMPTVPLADVTLQQKDMLLALELGRKLGSPVPLAAAANEMMNACRGLGLDHRDFVTAHEVYRRLGGET